MSLKPHFAASINSAFCYQKTLLVWMMKFICTGSVFLFCI